MRAILFSCLLLLCTTRLSAQEKEIEIRQAGSFQLDEENFPGANILERSVTKQVHLVHQGMDVWSDKAFFYKKENRFDAYGNVRIIQGDRLVLTSKKVNYYGEIKLAVAKEQVVLDNKEMLLKTDTLYFDRVKNIAYYPVNGTVYDSLTTISSKRGTYVSDTKKYKFENKVVVTNQDFILTSTRIDFYTETKHAFFYGATTIIGEDYVVRCREGFYNTVKKEGYFKDNASVDYNNRNIIGDSIYFNDTKKYASATQNIRITDTINNSFITGNYGQVIKEKDSTMTRKQLRERTMNNADMIINEYAGPEKEEAVIGNKLIVDAHLFDNELEMSCVSSSRLTPKDNARRNRRKRKYLRLKLRDGRKMTGLLICGEREKQKTKQRNYAT